MLGYPYRAMTPLNRILLTAIACILPGHAHARGGGGSAVIFALLLAVGLLPLLVSLVPPVLLSVASITSILIGAALLWVDPSWRYQLPVAVMALVFGVALAAGRVLFRPPPAESAPDRRPPAEPR